MKKIFMIFSFWPFFVHGQIFIDFESGLTGKWEQYPLNRWESSGNDPLSGCYSLHHTFDNIMAGSDMISLRTGLMETDSLITWDFLMRYAYLPSASNNWLIMLLSDSPANEMSDKDLFNGYGLGVNHKNSDDSLRLYYFHNGIAVKDVSLGMNYEKEAGKDPYHFNITLDTLKNWIIKGGAQDSALKLIMKVRLNENINFKSRYFGIRYNYTATCDRLFWLDDLSIDAVIIKDTLAPEIQDFKVLSEKSLKIYFSERVNSSLIDRKDITLFPGNIHPDSVMVQRNEICLYFEEAFIMREEYKLTIKEVADLEDNIARHLTIDFIWYEPQLYDVIISEIMADPEPAVYLPEREYLEIYNRSEYAIDLDSMTLKTANKKWLMPSFLLNPKSYLVITGNGEKEEFPGADVLFLFTSDAVITNEGQEISIYDKKGMLISALKFEKSWYGDSYKSKGGWSLERIDNNNICGEEGNWTASINPFGGTPGRINSVYGLNPDRERPKAEKSLFHAENKIEICFSESVNPFSLLDPSLYLTDKYQLKPDHITPVEPLCKSVMISYPEPLREGIIYDLKLSEKIEDCSGNQLDAVNGVRFGIPSVSSFLDILISEILFDPLPGCPEYIELYNASGKVLDFADLRIGIGKTDAGDEKIISPEPCLFFPSDYMVLTRNRNSLMSFFDCQKPDKILECTDLPVLTNKGGCVRLLNRSMQTVDEYCYSPNDHFILISDQKGVSLERMRFDKRTGNQAEWHSSSSISGFGTPGYENSQMISDNNIRSDFTILPEIFSPDNDGIDDIMIFSYVFDREGYSGTVCVFDPLGRIIKYLARNDLFGTSGFLSWDGRDESGRFCSTGLYLIYLEAIHPSGKKKKYKGTVVLARMNH